MITANLNAGRPNVARENYPELDDDTAEFLPILGAIASAVAPAVIQAAPSIIQGIGGMFRGGRRRAQPQTRPQQNMVRHAPPPPPRFAPPPQQFVPQPQPHVQQQQHMQQPAAPPQQPGFLSGALSHLMTLIQNPDITGALGNLLNGGISNLITVGSSQVPVTEASLLNAISEYAQLAAEDLESRGYGDTLEYMKDSTGAWKYDPNISSYRAEALIESINS